MIDYIDRNKLLRDIEKYHVSDGKFQHWVEIQPSVDILHWIPATSPPKVSGKYLVTHGGSHILSLDTYTTMEDAVRIFNDGYEDYIGWQSQNVIAWLPWLLKPYKGGE